MFDTPHCRRCADNLAILECKVPIKAESTIESEPDNLAILECKGPTGGEAEAADALIIQPYWNVKSFEPTPGRVKLWT